MWHSVVLLPRWAVLAAEAGVVNTHPVDSVTRIMPERLDEVQHIGFSGPSWKGAYVPTGTAPRDLFKRGAPSKATKAALVAGPTSFEAKSLGISLREAPLPPWPQRPLETLPPIVRTEALGWGLSARRQDAPGFFSGKSHYRHGQRGH